MCESGGQRRGSVRNDCAEDSNLVLKRLGKQEHRVQMGRKVGSGVCEEERTGTHRDLGHIY